MGVITFLVAYIDVKGDIINPLVSPNSKNMVRKVWFTAVIVLSLCYIALYIIYKYYYCL